MRSRPSIPSSPPSGSTAPPRAPTLIEVEPLPPQRSPLFTVFYVLACFLLGASAVLLGASGWQAHRSASATKAPKTSAPLPVHVALQPLPPQPVITKAPPPKKAEPARLKPARKPHAAIVPSPKIEPPPTTTTTKPAEGWL